MSDFWCGLDLGQAQDYSALILAERHAEEHPARYDVRHIERFPLGTSYPVIVEEVTGLLRQPELAGGVHLILDATGVGRAVADLFQVLAPVPVTITGGDTATHVDGYWRVPKRDLVGVVQVLLQSGRLKFAAGLPEAPLLVQELLAFQIKISAETGHDAYGAPWREGAHDDLVLALALACWYPERAWNPALGILSMAAGRGWVANAGRFGVTSFVSRGGGSEIPNPQRFPNPFSALDRLREEYGGG